MESQKVDMFMMANAKFFEGHQLNTIRERLLQMDDDKWVNLLALQLKDPTSSLIISLLAGNLGIDRFYVGDTGMGVGKLLTCGGLGIWVTVDWFLIQGLTKEKNMEMFNRALM